MPCFDRVFTGIVIKGLSESLFKPSSCIFATAVSPSVIQFCGAGGDSRNSDLPKGPVRDYFQCFLH